MRTSSLRRSVAALALGGLLLTACGDDDDAAVDAVTTTVAEETTSTTGSEPAETTTSTEPAVPGTEGADQVIEVTVAGGSVEGGGRHAVSLGDTVALVVRSDADDEVHLHGYDEYADVVADEASVLTFEATIPGVFEAELHDAGVPLVELEVS